MRTVHRTLPAADRALLRDAGAIALAMIAVGASFGAITIAYGLPTWVPFAMSTVVFAGGAQFLAVGLIAAGNPVAAVLAGLLLNARHHLNVTPGLRRARVLLDRASSARWFDGWRRERLETREDPGLPKLDERPPVARARTWLLAVGWRRHGLLDPSDVPGH